MRRYTILIMLLLGAACTAWTSFTEVGPGQRGVVKRFGRVIAVVDPGLHIGLPWGIERVERVAVDRVRSVTVGLPIPDAEDDDRSLVVPSGQLLTGDHNLVNVQIVIGYDVEVSAVTEFSLYGDQADGFVARAAEIALAEWVAGRGVDDVLLRGKVELPRWLVDQTQGRLDPSMGIRIQLVSVNDLNPPPQVKDAFEAVNSAQAEIQTEVSRARQAADAKWNQALAYRFNLEELTPGYVNGVKNLAKVEAAAFTRRLALLASVRLSSPYYLTAMWWDEMASVYAVMRAGGRLDLLDNRLARDGIDIIQRPITPKK